MFDTKFQPALDNSCSYFSQNFNQPFQNPNALLKNKMLKISVRDQYGIFTA